MNNYFQPPEVYLNGIIFTAIRWKASSIFFFWENRCTSRPLFGSQTVGTSKTPKTFTTVNPIISRGNFLYDSVPWTWAEMVGRLGFWRKNWNLKWKFRWPMGSYLGNVSKGGGEPKDHIGMLDFMANFNMKQLRSILSKALKTCWVYRKNQNQQNRWVCSM